MNDVPQSVHEALCRFLFAMMSDVDVRIRWCATHVVRRLASFSCEKVLVALCQEGNRTIEQSFRLPNAPFYWMAARLWLTIAIERAARESAAGVSHFIPFLKQVVFDEQLPHVLLREFAKSALQNLEAQGVHSLTDEEKRSLDSINLSPFPRRKKREHLKVSKTKKLRSIGIILTGWIRFLICTILGSAVSPTYLKRISSLLQIVGFQMCGRSGKILGIG